ncbi:hypothetical protein GAY29_11855 [Azospirillum brasilense]|uniref:hypothetical protein n=1 Tax=Azospirillum brasilense TaxID=192 RepID=UPI00190C16A9|nr:hypothetical protein [Azospirillum brasilense]MBK3733801.1 hypothetical protein [Azospirillum brasilense]
MADRTERREQCPRLTHIHTRGVTPRHGHQIVQAVPGNVADGVPERRQVHRPGDDAPKLRLEGHAQSSGLPRQLRQGDARLGRQSPAGRGHGPGGQGHSRHREAKRQFVHRLPPDHPRRLDGKVPDIADDGQVGGECGGDADGILPLAGRDAGSRTPRRSRHRPPSRGLFGPAGTKAGIERDADEVAHLEIFFRLFRGVTIERCGDLRLQPLARSVLPDHRDQIGANGLVAPFVCVIGQQHEGRSHGEHRPSHHEHARRPHPARPRWFRHGLVRHRTPNFRSLSFHALWMPSAGHRYKTEFRRTSLP